MTEFVVRKPHANLDIASRQSKAEKIERLLTGARLPTRTPLKLLEIGTGAGGIASHFASRAERAYEVDAIDTVDQRQTTKGYRFMVVSGVDIPYPDETFDVVISNHVIEHVGDRNAQMVHLREMARVLRPDGVIYLACPNRWQLVEPHYHLAMLSWWPRSWRSRYLAMSGKGTTYDCEPLSRRTLDRMLAFVPLAARNACAEAISDMLRHERSNRPLAPWLRCVPNWFWRALSGLCPTHIYLLAKSSDEL